jgi:hypothetical protein
MLGLWITTVHIARQPMYIGHNIEARLHNHCCSGKAISVKYYERMSVFLPSLPGKQISHFLHRVILSAICGLSVCLALPYFPTLSHKWHDFWGKVTEYKVCVFIFSATFVWNVSRSKKNSANCCHKRTQVFTWSACCSHEEVPVVHMKKCLLFTWSACCSHEVPVVLVRLEFSRQIF